ncbi:MAG: hypothetical protein HY719_02765, partial [Planctomycetes bacterium]|nr:hypothetical protein [Planctomycetota bacterium]
MRKFDAAEKTLFAIDPWALIYLAEKALGVPLVKKPRVVRELDSDMSVAARVDKVFLVEGEG